MQLVVTVLSFKTQGKGIHWLSALKLHEEQLAGLAFNNTRHLWHQTSILAHGIVSVGAPGRGEDNSRSFGWLELERKA